MSTYHRVRDGQQVVANAHPFRVTPIDPRRRNHPAYGPGRSLQPRHTVRYYQIRRSVRLALAGLVVTGVVALAATAVMLAAWAYGLLF